VGGVIPKDWDPFPAIEDEITDLWYDVDICPYLSKEVEEQFKKHSGRGRGDRTGFLHVELPRVTPAKTSQQSSKQGSPAGSETNNDPMDVYPPSSSTSVTGVPTSLPAKMNISMSIRVNGVSTRSSIFPSKLHAATNRLVGDCFAYDDNVERPTFLAGAVLPSDERGEYEFPLAGIKYDNTLPFKINEEEAAARNNLTYITRVDPKKEPGARDTGRAVFSAIHGQQLKLIDVAKPRTIKVAVTVDGKYVHGYQRPEIRARRGGGLMNGRDLSVVTPPEGVVQGMGMVVAQPPVIEHPPREQQPTLPVLRTLPTATGELRTVCLKPGNIPARNLNLTFSPLPHDIPAGELRATIDSSACQVCTLCDVDDEAMLGCKLCGITVHQNCISVDEGGSFSGTTNSKVWVCGVCNDKSINPNSGDGRGVRASRIVPGDSKKFEEFAGAPISKKTVPEWIRPSHNCVLCVHKGGSMLKLTNDEKLQEDCVADGIVGQDGEGWCHDICRLCVAPRAGLVSECCALCGVTEPTSLDVKIRKLSKCCVTGCNVLFHPMCAVAGNNVMGERAAQIVRRERAERFGEKKEREFKKKTEEEDVGNDFEFYRGYGASQVSEVDGLTQQQYHSFRDRDILTTSQYLLRFVAVDDASDFIEPVVFCSLHNPNRASSMSGLQRGGGDEGLFSAESMIRTIPVESIDEWDDWCDKVQSVDEKVKKAAEREASGGGGGKSEGKSEGKGEKKDKDRSGESGGRGGERSFKHKSARSKNAALKISKRNRHGKIDGRTKEGRKRRAEKEMKENLERIKREKK
jgi:hypothetical protein